MRDIRFRGKNINTGEWVYGYFKKNRHGDCYIEDDGLAVEVDPDTVGQMVCLLDEGDEVYEGDYLHYQGGWGGWGGWEDPDLCIVEWDDEDHNFTLISVIGDCRESISSIDEGYTIVGNIHTKAVLPDSIFVIRGDDTFILGDMDIYKTPEDFVEAVYKNDEAMEYLEDTKVGPSNVVNYYYVAGWVVPRNEPGSVKCWCIYA